MKNIAVLMRDLARLVDDGWTGRIELHVQDGAVSRFELHSQHKLGRASLREQDLEEGR